MSEHDKRFFEEEAFKLTSEYDQRLKEAADQAQHSNYIGKSWENFSESHLFNLLKSGEIQFLPEGHVLVGVLLLDVDPKIKSEAKGLKLPDSLIIEIDALDMNNITLRACDFKFSLPRARYAQVSPRTLLDLLKASPTAQVALSRKISELQEKK
ncbi:MAG: hypothetical protein H6773_04430 [Pseudomonadales bacterium]|nr:hypothetical protein [Candidatus Woesebacteria bacterium]MCB9801403.1 hypothetical protein [Pseudomonadales bacterium]